MRTSHRKSKLHSQSEIVRRVQWTISYRPKVFPPYADTSGLGSRIRAARNNPFNSIRRKNEYRERRRRSGGGGLMSLGKAFGFYMAAVVALIAGAVIAGISKAVIVYFVVYFACGIFLNRTVLRNLITFHPVYNTLHNVFSTKVRALIFWPISYLVLIGKIAVVRAI
ncbi:hypothetical protein [Burkholderia multivorans]|uniref:hypothetical protein n=2 Tax=Burkholderia multivorans TaxID=87883 RepID=UPI0028704995|nr:hypothetical protein [Burkholderia multivorans]